LCSILANTPSTLARRFQGRNAPTAPHQHHFGD
jgi:hypothetical protein